MNKFRSNNGAVNLFDKLIILVLALQSLGAVGGAFQVVRIIAILLMPLGISFLLKKTTIRIHYRYEIIFFSFLIIYGFISLIWVINLENGFREVIYITVNAILFFLIIYLANNAKDPYNSIIKGWIFFLLITIPIALYEIWFNAHLTMSILESDGFVNTGYEIIQRRSASVTFINPNGYVLLLIYAMPFLFSNFLKIGIKKGFLFLNTIISFFLIYVILNNASRGGLLCVFIQLFVLFYFLVKSKSHFFTSSLLFFLIFFLLIFVFKDSFFMLSNRLGVLGLGDASREDLIYNSLSIFYDSNFWGVGAGNLQCHLSKISNFLYAPHNLFLEIGVQYGLIIFFLFIGLLLRIVKKSFQGKDRVNKFIIVSSLLLLPLSSVINSTYISGVNFWLLLASLVIISDKYYLKNYG
ncbi:O-antigen ligase family protein [Bacteroidales bacterium OttesenSCG-928-A17]|nr:O-antigen ligase family protein [Bacteroidales bacterium OttesenSCG-928-A17]